MMNVAVTSIATSNHSGASLIISLVEKAVKFTDVDFNR